MPDLDSFIDMKELPAKARKWRRTHTQRNIYVCTICNCVAFPTHEVNCRCRKCQAPLLPSFENILDVQRQIKDYNGDDEMVAKLRAKMKMIRAAKKEHAELKLKRKPAVKERKYKKRDKRKTVYIYNVTIKPNAQYPQGFKGNLKVPQDQVSSFTKKADKTKTTYTLVSTEREWEVMDDIRKAMLEVKN